MLNYKLTNGIRRLDIGGKIDEVFQNASGTLLGHPQDILIPDLIRLIK